MKTSKFILLAATLLVCGCSSSNSSTAEGDATVENQQGTFDGEINGHPYVDLGLSVVWSPLNMNAECPEELGKYVAWGETDTAKVEFLPENCTTFNKSYAREMQGNIDHDVARNLWRHTWRLPTTAEVEELLTLCRWTNDTINGQIGYTVEGPSGKTIFLPAGGFKSVAAEAPDSCSGLGYYWTGTHTKGRAEKQKAFAWNFNTNDTLKAVVEIERFHGMLVRPVAKN